MKTQSDCIEGMFEKFAEEPRELITQEITIAGTLCTVDFYMNTGTKGKTNCNMEKAEPPEGNSYDIRALWIPIDNNLKKAPDTMLEYFREEIECILDKGVL